MPPSTPNADFAKLTVLVVDDDRQISRLIEEILRQMGFGTVLTAGDGNEALARIADAKTAIDMVICDWLMPGMDGLEFLRRVRRAKREVPFLMLTRRRAADDVLAVKDVGVSAYITKPFKPERLREKVQALAAKYLAARSAG